jgi:biopolymer transport protein ExbD/biopolymer transport protein TolR
MGGGAPSAVRGPSSGGAASRLRPGAGRARALSEINVTPLVDVMLVLLIVFMITAPLLATGMRVDLPQAASARPQDAKQPVVVTIGPDGALMLGHDPVAREALAPAIHAMLAGDTRPVHVRGDREVPYGTVVAVMDHLAAHGLTRLALLTQTGASPAAVPSAPR